MGLFEPSALEEELSRIGATRLLKEGEPKDAALLTYHWLKEMLSLEHEGDAPALYDMLSCLFEHSSAHGFSCEQRMEDGLFVFMITNANPEKNGTIQMLLELLLALIFERHGQFESEIVHSGNDIIVRIRPPKA